MERFNKSKTLTSYSDKFFDPDSNLPTSSTSLFSSQSYRSSTSSPSPTLSISKADFHNLHTKISELSKLEKKYETAIALLNEKDTQILELETNLQTAQNSSPQNKNTIEEGYISQAELQNHQKKHGEEIIKIKEENRKQGSSGRV